MNTLQGRTCVFAGGAGNLGAQAVRELAAGGMNVALLTHNTARVEQFAAELRDLPGHICALRDDAGVDPYAEAEKRFGSVDVVINATGSMEIPMPVEAISEAYLDFKIQHQIKDVFRMVQQAIPYLKKSRAGRIILTATCGADTGFVGENLLDSMTRGSTIALTKTLAGILAADAITVNCIARTGLEEDHEKERETDFDPLSILKDIPLGRLGSAAEYAALIDYLASEESGFMTGQILRLGGGL